MKITVHTHTQSGIYDQLYTRILAVCDTTGYSVLIDGEWCGQGSIHGGMYRPHAYELSPPQTQSAIAAWGNEYLDGPEYLPSWERWICDVLPETVDLGRSYKSAVALIKTLNSRMAEIVAL